MRRSIVLAMLMFLFSPTGGVLAAAPSEATGKQALDWKQWRGNDRSAVASETGLLDRWPDEGPPVVWRSKIGVGFSSVSISERRIYTMWDEGGRQFLFCLDALTGGELWRHDLGVAFKHHYGNGPRSTPLIDEGVVFAVGTNGRLVALNKSDGKPLWQHDLVKKFSADLPSYGFSSSPLVVGDRLVIEAGAAEGTFMAFDKKSGEVVWSTENDQPAYSSPIAVSIGEVEQIVFWSAHGLHAVSPSDGGVLWRYSWETFCPVTGDPLNTGTPIFIAPDRIYISSGAGAAVIRIARSEKVFKPTLVWENDKMRSDVNSALLLGDSIYGFDHGTLKCLDAGTGEIRWTARGFQRGSLIAADGKLIVLGEGGNLALVEANPDAYVEHANIEVLKGKNWTSPSLAQGRLYLRNHEEMLCLDVRDR